MQIQELMTKDLITTSSNENVLDAAKKMREHDLGSLPVVDDKRLVGILTDRDIVIRCVAEERELGGCHVVDVMSKETHCCKTGDTPEQAMEIMATKRVRRLPVVDDNEQLVGIISIGALAESTEQPEAVCTTIEAVRQPAGV